MRVAKAIQAPRGISQKRHLLVSFAVSGAIQAMNIVTGTILARHLGPSGRGELAAVILWPNILAGIGGLGVAEALTYYLARGSLPRDRLIQTSLILCIGQSLGLIVIGLLIVPRVLADYGPHIISLTSLYLAFIPLNLISMCLMAALNGHYWYKRYHWLRLMNILVTVVGLAQLALTGRLTVESAAIAYLFSWFITMIGAALAFRTQFAPVRLERTHAGWLLSFGLKSHSGFLFSLLNEWLDKLVISLVLAPASLGLYVVAVTLTSVSGLVGSSASIVALPLIAGMDDGDDRSEAARRLVAVTFVASIFVTIPLFTLLPAIVRFLFGPEFSASVGPGRILLVAAVFLSLNRVLTMLFRAIGRPLEAGIGESIALVVTVVGLAFLLRRFALVGAATTSLAAYLTSMIWMIRRVSRALRLPARKFLVPDRDIVLSLQHMGETIGTPHSRARRV